MTNHLLNTSCNWQLLGIKCYMPNAISSPPGDRIEASVLVIIYDILLLLIMIIM